VCPPFARSDTPVRLLSIWHPRRYHEICIQEHTREPPIDPLGTRLNGAPLEGQRVRPLLAIAIYLTLLSSKECARAYYLRLERLATSVSKTPLYRWQLHCIGDVHVSYGSYIHAYAYLEIKFRNVSLWSKAVHTARHQASFLGYLVKKALWCNNLCCRTIIAREGSNHIQHCC